MSKSRKKFIAFLLALLLAGSTMNSLGDMGHIARAYAQEYIYYGVLNISIYGYKGYNTGLNYEMTGGTAGKIYDGAKLAVIDEKVNQSGKKVSYVYSEDLGRNCYVTTKYIKAITPSPTPTPLPASVPLGWESEYDREYGVDYWKLFAENPLYLDNAAFNSSMSGAFRHAREVVESYSDQEESASFIESLGNGIGILSQEFLAWLHIGNNLKEQKRIEATEYFLQELQGNERAMEEIRVAASDVFDIIDTAFANQDGTARNAKLSEAVGVPASKVKRMISWCSARKKKDMIGKDIDATEFANTIFKLYGVEIAVIESLQREIDESTDLYYNLELLKKQIKESPVTHFKNELLKKEVVSFICEAIKKGAGGGVALDIVQLGIDIFTHYLYQGIDINDYIQALYLYSYALTLQNSLTSKQIAFMRKTQEVTAEAAENYEFVFNVYLASAKAMLKAAQKVAKEESHVALLQKDIDRLEGMTYGEYVRYCLSERKLREYVQSKEIRDGIYRIVPECAPSCVLGLSGNGTQDGTNVEIQERQENGSQLFAVSKIEGGFYSIRNVSSGKLLDVASGSEEAGGNIQIYTDNGTDAQKWILCGQEDDYYTVISVRSNLALDISGGQGTGGTNVQQWYFNYTGAQRFRFESAEQQDVQAKIEELFEKLGGNISEFAGGGTAKAGYFTTDQKPCKMDYKGKHYEKRDSNSAIVKTAWFQNIFGQVNISNFPKHLVDFSGEVDNKGRQCFGFACFAQWYLYQQSNTDSVQGNFVKQGQWNAEFLRQYAQPGDILRINLTNDFHSMVVYSVEDDGVVVLDCNCFLGAENACRVAMHKLKYTKDVWNGRMVWVYRGERNLP